MYFFTICQLAVFTYSLFVIINCQTIFQTMSALHCAMSKKIKALK